MRQDCRLFLPNFKSSGRRARESATFWRYSLAAIKSPMLTPYSSATDFPQLCYTTKHGRVTYTSGKLPDLLPGPLAQVRLQYNRPQLITIRSIRPDRPIPREDLPTDSISRFTSCITLATSRDSSALRFLRGVISSQPKVELVSTQYTDQERRPSAVEGNPSFERRPSASQALEAQLRRPSASQAAEPQLRRPSASQIAPEPRSRSRSIVNLSGTQEEENIPRMPSLQALHHRASNIGLHRASNAGNHAHGSPLGRVMNSDSLEAPKSLRARASSLRNGSVVDIPDEKPIASSTGVSMSINLAEPVLFLQGFQEGENAVRSTAMLRGALHLKVTKTVKLKTVSLSFKGKATTKWPEGKKAFYFHSNEAKLTAGRYSTKEDGIRRN
jgi:hypothetical protein